MSSEDARPGGGDKVREGKRSRGAREWILVVLRESWYSVPALLISGLGAVILVLYSGRVYMYGYQLRLFLTVLALFIPLRLATRFLAKVHWALRWSAYAGVFVVFLLFLSFIKLPANYYGPFIFPPFSASRDYNLQVAGKKELSGQRAKLNYQVRDSMIVFLNHVVERRVNIGKNAFLRFGVGVTESPGGKPYQVSVWVKNPLDNSPSRVYTEQIERKRSRWTDIEVDLSAYEGHGRTLSIQVTATDPADKTGEVFLSRVSMDTADERARLMRKPNVVVILVDTLRADHLNSYGYTIRETDPNLSMWWKTRGVRFENVYSPSSWTTPAVASLFTSRYLCGHGVGSSSLKNMVMRPELTTLPEVLQENGYDTVAVSVSHLVNPGFNFNEGFDSFYDLGLDMFYWHGDREAAKVASKWLKQGRQRPFFMYVHLMNPHAPYSTEPFITSSSDNLLRALAVENTFRSKLSNLYSLLTFQEKPWTEEDLANSRVLRDYDGEIARTDESIQRVMNALYWEGYLENTLVIVTGDHGEEFREHEGWGHMHTLYQELLRVPLFIMGPMVNQEGGVVDCPVSLIDIMPTVLEIADIQLPRGIEGESLWPLIKKGECLERPLYSEMGYFDDSQWKSVIKDGYKLIKIRRGQTVSYLLFDLAADPYDQNDLAPELPGVVEELSRYLVVLEQKEETGPQRAYEITDDRKAILKSLGYLED